MTYDEYFTEEPFCENYVQACGYITHDHGLDVTYIALVVFFFTCFMLSCICKRLEKRTLSDENNDSEF